MTNLSFRFLCVILTASVLGGGYLLAPSPEQLGHDFVSCEEWLADPRPGPITLTGCVVDLTEVSAGRSHERLPQEAVLAVRAAGGDPDEPTPDLTFISRETAHVRLAAHMDSMRALDPDRLGRFQQRHAAELVRIGDVSGTGEIDPSAAEDYRLVLTQAGDPSPLGRAFGIVLFLFGLLGLLILVPLQRKWTRNRLRLTGKGKPLSF